MNAPSYPHALSPGYYWYTMKNDPPSVIHIHDNGGATLMGTELHMSPAEVAEMIGLGEKFSWIEPPQDA